MPADPLRSEMDPDPVCTSSETEPFTFRVLSNEPSPTISAAAVRGITSARITVYTYQERSFIVLSFCALFSEQKRGSLRWRGHRDPVLLPKGWVLLQHYLIAFLQSAEHFCFGAIGDAQIYGKLLLAVLIV